MKPRASLAASRKWQCTFSAVRKRQPRERRIDWRDFQRLGRRTTHIFKVIVGGGGGRGTGDETTAKHSSTDAIPSTSTETREAMTHHIALVFFFERMQVSARCFPKNADQLNEQMKCRPTNINFGVSFKPRHQERCWLFSGWYESYKRRTQGEIVLTGYERKMGEKREGWGMPSLCRYVL